MYVLPVSCFKATKYNIVICLKIYNTFTLSYLQTYLLYYTSFLLIFSPFLIFVNNIWVIAIWKSNCYETSITVIPYIFHLLLTVGLLTLLSRNNVFYSPESMFPPVLDHWHLYVLSSQNKNIFKYNYVQVFLGIYQMFMPIFTWIHRLKEKIYELSQ